MTASLLLASCQEEGMPQVVLPQIDTTNPLLAEWDTPHQTPPFSQIKLSDYEPAFDTAIEVNRAEIDAIVANPAKPTFRNTIVPLAQSGEYLSRIAGLFFNLLEANSSDEMQQIAMRVQPKLTQLSNDQSLNPELFARVKAVYENPGWFLSNEDKRLLEDTYKGFVRSGANLSDEDKAKYREYSEELSQLTLTFGQNSLAATNAFSLNITDPSQVEELPGFVKDALSLEAKNRGEKGWTVTLKAPSYVPFMMYSSKRELKEKLYRAYNTRAYNGEFDNSANIRRIAELRMRIANLLGFPTYAEYALEDKMAHDTQTVNSFLGELLDATKEYAKKDYDEINAYAKANGLQGDVMPWDWGYYSEKFKNENYAISDEQIKPYLSLENVKPAVFMLANRLYGINFTENKDIQVYHPEVTAYEVTDRDGKFLAVLYLDFFPRDSKRAGAWMTEFRDTKCVAGKEIRPLVSLVMNFTKPTETDPSLLTFDELETFLHEFGHSLHGMLAKGTYSQLNGTSVKRDFVELPSQIMENWACEKEYLSLWAKHYKTGEVIPDELIEKIIAAKNYHAAYANIRQLSFGMDDMAWHTLTEPYTGDVAEFEREAMEPTQVTPTVDGTCMSTAFTHIFAGGYAAGYYGYKWAEVLAADGFSLFREKGIFDQKTASKFRRLLESGDQKDPMDLYIEFRGHKPQPQALVDQMGLK